MAAAFHDLERILVVGHAEFLGTFEPAQGDFPRWGLPGALMGTLPAPAAPGRAFVGVVLERWPTVMAKSGVVRIHVVYYDGPMSHMQEHGSPGFAETALAERLRHEREARGWSLADLAGRAGVSRAMISRIERAEASPTAVLLARLSAAFGLSLSALLARVEAEAAGPGRLRRRAEQPVWRDPQSGYVRRAVSPEQAVPEITHVELPPGARVAYPASACLDARGQCLWVLAGKLAFSEGAETHTLESGDCIALDHPTDRVFANASDKVACHYVLAVVRE